MMQKLAMVFSAAGLVMTVACSQTDPGITTAVKSKLAADTTVKASRIDVDTSNGVVTLTGVVEVPAAKEQAVVIARRTDGVKDVIDHITVNAPAATNPEPVGERAGQDIKDATKTAGEKVSSATDKAVDATKDAAREATDKTKNAAEKTGDFITDSAITTAVKTKLLADDKTPGLKIDVDTNNGVVTLSGTVPTKVAENKAVADARGTKGVKRVVNKLKVAS